MEDEAVILSVNNITKSFGTDIILSGISFHIEKGENPEQAALREVEEETGVSKLHIVKELPSTWHCYQLGDEWRLKRTYWYLMESEETIQAKPQTEEGISEVKLVGAEGIEGFLKETFRSISEILGGDLRQVVTK